MSRAEVPDSLRAAPVFAAYVLLTLVVAGVIGLITFDVVDLGMAHFGQRSHRVHDLTFGFLFTTSIAGILAQLRRPRQNIAGMLMALIPWGALLLAGLLSADVQRVVLRNPSTLLIPLTAVAAVLHPAGRRLFRSFDVARANPLMLALVLLAAVPLLVLAASNLGLQGTLGDDHAEMGHYGFMAAFSFTVTGVGLLASLRPDGWRLPALVAALLPPLLGTASLLYPVASSFSLPWALAAMAWGAAFIAAAGLTRDARASITPGERRAHGRSQRE